VDRDSIDRIRSATFPVGRRGYEKREVDRFLNRLAEWLETGAGDQTRAELVRRDLERIGQQTGRILTEAHDAGQRLLGEAEHEARRIVAVARAEAKRIVDEANQRRAEIEAVI
jgi:DivIVA domain-containing protein